MTREDSDRWILDHVERAAMAIVLGEFEGSKFNWTTMQFETDKA